MGLEQDPMFSALHDEVAVQDCYGVKRLLFVPDLIIDIGANIGVFTQYVSGLFPEARIVCVEPDETNFATLSLYAPSNAVVLNKALGRGKVWRAKDAASGANEAYLGQYFGFPDGHQERRVAQGLTERTSLESVTIEDLFNDYWRPGTKTLVKIDCEGAENSVFDHEPSMECLRGAEFVAIEIHRAGLGEDGSPFRLTPHLMKTLRHQLKSFDSTHDCSQNHVVFTAAKRGLSQKVQAYSGHGLERYISEEWSGWVEPDWDGYRE